jgi:hypothetical protein
MSDLSSPLLLLLAFQGAIALIRTAGQIVIMCIALRGAAPEQRARILRALHGKSGIAGTRSVIQNSPYSSL